MNTKKDLITSCGVARDINKPRVGVIGANECNEFIHDDIDQGKDITYDEFLQNLEDEGKTLEEIEEESDFFESGDSTILFGPAWFQNDKGKYEIDKTKEYAATFSQSTNIICIEFSKHTARCNNTSPCYVMADGSGPCGDLNSKGDILAYTLPSELLKNESE